LTNIWAVSRQNQHNGFATSMDQDQPAHPRSLIRIHAVCLQTLLQVEKLIANSMDPDQTAWMLVANRLRWFCRDTAHIFYLDFKGVLSSTPQVSVFKTISSVLKMDIYISRGYITPSVCPPTLHLSSRYFIPGGTLYRECPDITNNTYIKNFFCMQVFFTLISYKI
jgi:hypothetical protein